MKDSTKEWWFETIIVDVLAIIGAGTVFMNIIAFILWVIQKIN